MRIGIALAPAPCTEIIFAEKLFQSLKFTSIVNDFTINLCRIAAVGIHILHPGPVINKIIQNRITRGNICFGNKLLNQGFKFAAGIKSHSGLQRVNIAEPLKLGQGLNIIGNGHFRLVNGIGIIGVEPDVGHRSGRTVGFNDSADLRMGIAVGIGCALLIVRQINSRYAGLRKSYQLAVVNHAVLIGVFPDFDFVPGGILIVKHTVIISV